MALDEGERIKRGLQLKEMAARADALADLILSPEPEGLLQLVLPIGILGTNLQKFAVDYGKDMVD